MDDDYGSVRWFGTYAWNGLAEGAPELRVPIPVGMLCAHCDEPIGLVDEGALILFSMADGDSFRPQHADCFTRLFIGGVRHQLRKCSCYGNGGTCGPEDGTRTKREEAAMAVRLYQEQQRGERLP